MSEHSVAEPLFWLFASVACLSLVLVVASALYSVVLQKRLHLLKTEFDKQLHMLQTGVQGMGGRVLELENRLSYLRQSQDDLNSSTQDFAYSKARSLLDTGMSEDAIAETSGLTRSEVGLMKLVHDRSSFVQSVS